MSKPFIDNYFIHIGQLQPSLPLAAPGESTKLFAFIQNTKSRRNTVFQNENKNTNHRLLPHGFQCIDSKTTTEVHTLKCVKCVCKAILDGQFVVYVQMCD